MRYLLDTHVVWAHATNPASLSPAARTAIDTSPIADLCVLDVTLYELARHFAAGRISAANPLKAIRAIAETYHFIHTDADIAWDSAQLDWQKRNRKGMHLDPADRALVAACRHLGLVLVTADEEIHHSAKKQKIRVLW